jgi:hypothetical protein
VAGGRPTRWLAASRPEEGDERSDYQAGRAAAARRAAANSLSVLSRLLMKSELTIVLAGRPALAGRRWTGTAKAAAAAGSIKQSIKSYVALAVPLSASGGAKLLGHSRMDERTQPPHSARGGRAGRLLVSEIGAACAGRAELIPQSQGDDHCVHFLGEPNEGEI